MIVTKKIEYQDATSTFEGVVAYEEGINTQRPVIMIAPTFKGQTAFEEKKAIEFAKLGYIGFAIDTYGKGIRGNTTEEAFALMRNLDSDRALLLSRMKTSLKAAKSIEHAAIDKIGAIGFCFGGKSVLDLARSGERLSGIVSFHGVYDPPKENPPVKITTPVLVLHGWGDPLAPPTAVVALAKELTEREADWEFNVYGHTGHAFTNPTANAPGMAYNEKVDQQSWKRMTDFFANVIILQ